MSLAEVMRLQNQLSQVLALRFRKSLALVFTDVVGATPYFQRFGDEAGHRLLQRNYDAVARVLDAGGGRMVDTAGDGVFSTFPSSGAAAEGLIRLQDSIATENQQFDAEHKLSVRAGLHYGVVLSDDITVVGDAVNVAARVTATAAGQEVRVTSEAYDRLPQRLRLRCAPLGPESLRGVAEPVELFRLECRDLENFASSVCIRETEEVHELPSDLPVIRFGRLQSEGSGEVANEVVVSLPDSEQSRRISRRHFELRREWAGFRLRSLTSQETTVDGRSVGWGEEVALGPRSVVQLSGVVTLAFGRQGVASADLERTLAGGAEIPRELVDDPASVRETADSLPPFRRRTCS